MTHAIKKLDDDLINKIAAGEVIERPASVVKELVENSLDAGSTQISVAIKEGGKKWLEVSDNGLGIRREELELAVARHATSKIGHFEDIYKLTTKGFRGEALASICAVAKVSVASQFQGEEAAEIIVEGGKTIDKKSCAHAQGTTVTVKYLFFQTPARLKFLKSDETETSHIVDVVTKLALSHPQVGFLLKQDDKTLIDVPSAQNLFERLTFLLGKDISEQLFEFFGEGAGMKMCGFVGHPQLAKSQRNFCYLFVNGRAVQDKVLWHAIQESYRNLLMKGKYPVMVLNLFLDENLLDVNVHPTKAEVRFHHSQQVHQFVYHVLREKLEQAPWVKNLPQQYQIPNALTNESFVPSVPVYNRDISFNPVAMVQRTESQKQIQFGRTPYAVMHPIGQFLGTYILCESGDTLILIDQHAAHERIGFEKLMLEFQKNGILSEHLLTPETFDLKPSDAEILKSYVSELKSFGFDVEFFGGNTFVLKAEPVLLKGKITFVRLISDLIEDIKETGELSSLKDRISHVFATMACHAQIRANHHLHMDEMRSLLLELDRYQFTGFCPHGRPVSVEVTRAEIEKWFKRVL